MPWIRAPELTKKSGAYANVACPERLAVLRFGEHVIGRAGHDTGAKLFERLVVDDTTDCTGTKQVFRDTEDLGGSDWVETNFRR